MERSSSLNQFNKKATDQEAAAEADDSISSSSEVSSVESLDSDLSEEVESDQQLSITDPLQDMSSLLHQLPSKRGLSKHYQGKSQSFTSLSEATSLDDLAKPENLYNKKLKSYKSYAAGIADCIYKRPTSSSNFNSKNSSSSSSSSANQRASASSSWSKRNNGVGSFMGSRPPSHPHRSASTSSFSNQTALFA